jgi:hypothetical protein
LHSRFNFAVLGVLVPILLLAVLVSGGVILVAVATPHFSKDERAELRDQWNSSLVLKRINMRCQSRRRGDNWAASHSEASRDEMREALRADARCFLSPEAVHALPTSARLSKAQVAEEQRLMIYSYAGLTRDDLVGCFVGSFFEWPCASVKSGLELAISAKNEGKKLQASDNILADEVSNLASTVESIVAGCASRDPISDSRAPPMRLDHRTHQGVPAENSNQSTIISPAAGIRTLSGRDDLVDGLFASDVCTSRPVFPDLKGSLSMSVSI